MIPQKHLIALLLVSMLAGCARHEPVLYQIPFGYSSLAAGHEGTRLPILLPEKEAESFSMALLEALQDMEHSIVEPRQVNVPLPENSSIKTDPVPLRRTEINDHNAATRLSPIQLNARYRLSYNIRYKLNTSSSLEQKHFELSIQSKLERSGAAGEWHRYKKPYSSTFFASRLRDHIEKYLLSN